MVEFQHDGTSGYFTVSAIINFENQMKIFDSLWENTSFLWNQLIMKNQLTKTITDAKTNILEKLSRNKETSP